MDLSVPHDLSVRARYVFSVDGTILGEPLENAILQIRNGLAAVNSSSQHPDVDLGNVAIIPGLVNAHTHLEFSNLDAPLVRQPDATFSDWISAVLQWRQRRDAMDDLAHASSVEQGLRESTECGVQLLGEIATQNEWPSVFQERNLRPSRNSTFDGSHGVRFLELIGLGPERIAMLLDEARQYLTNATPANWQAGLSPHAPYTVGWTLLESVAELSRRFRAPIAMHLAETSEELEFLSSHSGPLLKLLDRRGVWDASAVPRGVRPIDYLEMLSTAHRALIIHGNYLAPADWRFLAEHADRMSVVYCPRTFHYFGHRKYPLERMLAAGVHVAIGTDSRASNPNLNLFEELKFVRHQHPNVPPRQLLELGTENGASALGMKSLALRTIDLPDQEAADPFALLFDY